MPETAKPNIVLVIADGWAAGEESFLPQMRAPLGELEKILQEGVVFNQCYVQSVLPVPGACSLMTGWYPHVKGHRTKSRLLSPAEPFLLKQLKEAGYSVGWAGRNDAVTEREAANVCDFRYRPDERLPEQAENPRAGLASDRAALAEADRWLRSGLKEPFCVCLNLTHPADSPTMGEWDAAVGKLAAACRERGVWDSTALFFFGSRGAERHSDSRPQHAVESFRDERIHVPLMIKLPRSIPTRTAGASDALVELIDVHETIVRLAGLPDRHTRFGKALIGLYTGEKDEHRSGVFCEGSMSVQGMADGTTARSVMIRTREWKYVRRLGGNHELYDLTNDPAERHNAADLPRHAETQRRLIGELVRWYMETVDVVPFEPLLDKMRRLNA